MTELLAFLATALSPVGGMVIAVPLGVLAFGYPAWSTALVGVGAAYLQVIVVDSAWDLLERRAWWQRWLERQRRTRVARMLFGADVFWPTVLAAPLIGPWVVMALMRWAGVPQRRVALPILLGLSLLAGVLLAVCHLAPQAMDGVLASGG